MPTAIVNFSLDIEKDKDLLRWIGQQPNRSAAIREALRSHVSHANGPTLADVLAEIRALPSKLTVVGAQTPTPTSPGDEGEPEKAAANLNGLLERLGKGDLG